jgi:glutamate-5-semialdehyde dehydrogenase
MAMDHKQSGLTEVMREVGQAARKAAARRALSSDAQRNQALRAAGQALRDHAHEILEANVQDYAAAELKGTTPAFLDRLRLDAGRLEAIAKAVEAVALLADPLGRVLAEWTQPNGLRFERVATPLGVIGIIFESRPNVAADAGALCLKSGNAAILRSGSESFLTAVAITKAMRAGLHSAGLPEASIQLVPTRDRAAVGLMLSGFGGQIDVIVPRGGRSLVERVQSEARVPVFAHLEGLCHVYVDKAADLAMARAIVLNAKLRRTGICGSAETLLIDRACFASHALPLVHDLLDAGCELRGDAAACVLDSRIKHAVDQDYFTEYLAKIMSVAVVDGIDGALKHIAHYGSHHTDAIVTEDQNTAERFLREVDSAIVLHNASTQFADGGEFGFGAEIGIATGRMHARGPVGVEQLTSFKYRVHGSGQIRPV